MVGSMAEPKYEYPFFVWPDESVAGDGLAIRSNMIHATWVQAKELLSVEHCFVTGNPCGTDTCGEKGCQCANCIAWREKGGLVRR
jgi:hypothetical protein